MTPAKLRPREIVRGNTFVEMFSFSKKVNGVLIPLNLREVFFSIQMDLRRAPNRKGELIASFTLENGIVISGSDNHKMAIVYNSELTDKLQAGTYYRDILFVSALEVGGKKVNTYFEGNIVIVENITVL